MFDHLKTSHIARNEEIEQLQSYPPNAAARGSYQAAKSAAGIYVCGALAGEEGFEPSAYGFGDRRSTN